jgi:hypothetical protein
MKRIQIFKAAAIVLAIGGAIATRGNSKQTMTYFTVTGNNPTSCTLASSSPCGGGSTACTVASGGNTTTYYHPTSQNCGVELTKTP